MTRKIITSLMVIAVAAMMVGMGTFAYFSDTETSSGNTFTAGTLDLTLTESGGAPISLTNMKPGDSASGSITVTNVGTLPGSLYATSWYVTADGSPNPYADMTADEVAQMLLITAFTVDGNAVSIPDTDGDTRITVFDMVNDISGVVLADYPGSPGQLGTWYSYDTNMAANGTHTYSLTVQFDTAADNDYQGDGITWTFEFLLTQQ